MKKIAHRIKTITIMILVLLSFGCKREFENEKKKFYNATFNSEVVKIIDGRGTKIFYSEKDFFYTDFCVNAHEIEQTIKIGDVVKKEDSAITFFRENKAGELERILVTKIEK